MSNLDSLNKHNFKFNKAYGQNFIFDKNFLNSIAEGIVDKDTTVLEIGAGAGTLTSILCEKAKKVYSFEIDNNLKPILTERLAEFDNIELIFGDIMKFETKDIEDRKKAAEKVQQEAIATKSTTESTPQTVISVRPSKPFSTNLLSKSSLAKGVK